MHPFADILPPINKKSQKSADLHEEHSARLMENDGRPGGKICQVCGCSNYATYPHDKKAATNVER